MTTFARKSLLAINSTFEEGKTTLKAKGELLGVNRGGPASRAAGGTRI
jgi:hypothetical protein